MNKMLFGSVALAAVLAGPAMAADMGVPRAAYVPPPSWTGFYVGGNFGGVWGNTDPGFIAGCLPGNIGTTQPGGVIPGTIGATVCNLNTFGTGNVATAVSATGTQPFHNKGWTGGGQIGFNYQYQWAVFGIEADFQRFKPKGSTNSVGAYPLLPGTGVPCTGANFGGCGYGFAQESDGKWLTTVRGRVGAVWGNFMIYGTMGIAWAKLDFTSSFIDGTCQFGTTNPWNCDSSSAAFSQVRYGPVGGGGLSYMLTRNLIVSVEYLRVELWGVGGDVSSINTQGTVAPGTFTSNYHYDATYIENIVRGKVDFKF